LAELGVRETIVGTGFDGGGGGGGGGGWLLPEFPDPPPPQPTDNCKKRRQANGRIPVKNFLNITRGINPLMRLGLDYIVRVYLWPTIFTYQRRL
jgi:hypothetical protein